MIFKKVVAFVTVMLALVVIYDVSIGKLGHAVVFGIISLVGFWLWRRM